MSGWTDDRVDLLKKLHAEDYSFSHIAKVLGGTTRNACIAKADRLGLAARPGSGGGPKKKAPEDRIRSPRKHHNDGVMAAPMLARPALLNEPEPIGPIRGFPVGGCRFIRADIATGVDWRCCGAPALRFDIPWCDYHVRIVSQSPKQRVNEHGKAELAAIAASTREAAE